MTPPAPGSARDPLVSAGDLIYLSYPLVPLRVVRLLTRAQARWLRLARRATWLAVRDNFVRYRVAPPGSRSADRLALRFLEDRQMRRALMVLGPRLSRTTLDRLFPLEGTAHLDRALAAGGGAVLVGSHLNSLCGFLARYQLQLHGYDARVALPIEGRPVPESRTRRLLDRLAGRSANPVLEGALHVAFNVRPVVRALARNAAVLTMGDGWHSTGLVDAELLGRPVQLTSGPIGVALAARAPVIPLFCVGTPGERVRLCLEEPITPPPGRAPPDAVAAMVREFARRLDRRLRAGPVSWEHWQEPDALDQMARLSGRPLGQRYAVTDARPRPRRGGGGPRSVKAAPAAGR